MRTLIYDVPDSKIMDEILSSPKIKVVYTIHPHANFKKDLDSSELTKKNFPPHINFEVSQKNRKNGRMSRWSKWVAVARHGLPMGGNESYGLQEAF